MLKIFTKTTSKKKFKCEKVCDFMKIRNIDIKSEYDSYLELEKICHGCNDKDVWPKRQLIKLEGKGLSLKGAYVEDKLIGADLCVVGLNNNLPIFVSQSLSIDPEYRGKSIALLLRKRQLEEAEDRGITEIHWPFDPLRANNAWLYFSKLGVEIIDYKVDYFGHTDFGLQAGFPTDRLWVKLRKPTSVCNDSKTNKYEVVEVVKDFKNSLLGILNREDSIGVLIPKDIDTLIKSDFVKAKRARENSRLIFEFLLGSNRVLRGLQKNEKGEILYVFSKA
jgi:predicted GNAT superfamily acetyltransferase